MSALEVPERVQQAVRSLVEPVVVRQARDLDARPARLVEGPGSHRKLKVFWMGSTTSVDGHSWLMIVRSSTPEQAVESPLQAQA